MQLRRTYSTISKSILRSWRRSTFWSGLGSTVQVTRGCLQARAGAKVTAQPFLATTTTSGQFRTAERAAQAFLHLSDQLEVENETLKRRKQEFTD